MILRRIFDPIGDLFDILLVVPLLLMWGIAKPRMEDLYAWLMYPFTTAQ